MEANTAPRQAKADLNSCGTQRRGVAGVRAACCMPSTLQAHPQQHSAVMVSPWIYLCRFLAVWLHASLLSVYLAPTTHGD
jgi:hypothetical protein